MNSLFLLASFLFLVFSTEEVDETDVHVLTTDNFDSFISSNPYVLVEFYAPWCGHCKRLTPEYAQAATTLKGEGAEGKLAKVDATVEGDLATKYGVRGYPTIKFFKNGKPVDYEGGRTAAEIVSWVQKKSGPPSKELKEDEVSAYVSGEGTRGILYFGAKEEVAIWTDVASHAALQTFQFGHVQGEKAKVVLHKQGEEPLTYDGEFNTNDLVNFFTLEGFPLVDELAQESWTRAQEGKKSIVSVFMEAKTDAAYEVALAFAKANKGKYVVTWSTQPNIAERWGASGKVLPTVVFVDFGAANPSLVIWDEDTETSLSEESLTNFVSKAADGTYNSYQKSEPIPEDNTAPVTVVVGKNFKDVVLAEGKDVFVEFYAPWCGHCKKLAPVWDELGQAFETDANLVVAKMDATANKPPKDIDIKGFPTLILFNADNEQIPYEGERELEPLKEFLKANRKSAASGERDEL